MAKTNPIGVRFDKELLTALQEDSLADSPQKALNFLTEFYKDKRPKTNIYEQLKDSKILSKKPITIKEIELPVGNKIIYGEEEMKKRVAELKKELANPPKTPLIGLKNWMKIRVKELGELNEKLNAKKK